LAPKNKQKKTIAKSNINKLPRKAKKISIIMAHPDDAELLCFGTILYFVNRGYEANVVIVTDGCNGMAIGPLPESIRKAINDGIRREESQQAFSEVGVSTSFLGLPDGYLSINIELVSAMEKYLKEYQPEIVITHSAIFNAIEHHDHIAVGAAVVNAAARSSSVKTLLQAQPLTAELMPFVPNYFVNITPYLKAKMRAISKHETQVNYHSYMSEHFHQNRASINAFAAGRDRFAADELYETFFASLIIQD
jgi:LmbE family N-acetylglucosaminyl deacetylase